jgi:crotonobetainyl-CoA:carnitine CoA-transferase CaiB-like acyl-CoA transferase
MCTSIHTTLAGQEIRMSRPLDGIRVLDLSMMIAGPYCGRLLADLGAEVVKIEPPEGDFTRLLAPVRDGCSSYFGHLNAGKKCIVLDLKTAAGREAAQALVEKADVLLENFRPGVVDRLGLGWATTSRLNPRLVQCSISGYGQSGPARDRPAYAPIVHASSGYDLAVMALQEGQQKPQNTAIMVADILSGTFAFGAIQAALLERTRTGKGRLLDVPLLDSMLQLPLIEFQRAQFGEDDSRVAYGPVRSADGFVVVAPITQKNFEAMADAAGRPDWKQRHEFADPIERRRNYVKLMRELEEWTVKLPGAEIERIMMATGTPCARHRTIAEVMDDRDILPADRVATVRDKAGPFRVPEPPFRAEPPMAAIGTKVDALGEHTDSVLRDWLGG